MAVNQTSVKIGKVSVETTVFLLCDIQERFKDAIKYFEELIIVARRLITAAKIMEIPIVATEQYPKGLGKIVSELDTRRIPVFDKTLFSMATPEVEKYLKEVCPNLKSLVLFGIETHVCVQQTALDFIEKGYDVHVIADSTSSRSMTDRMIAFERIRQSGGFITTSESILFSLLKDAKNQKFREVQKLVLESAPEQGLVAKY